MKIQKTFVLTGLALFLWTILTFVLSYRVFFHGGQSFEFCHYADIGNNILSGRGYQSTTFFPAELAVFKKNGILPNPTGPIISRFPSFAYWSALWMAVAGKNDFGMALGNGMAHALLVLVIFVTGNLILNFRAGLLTAILLSIHPQYLIGYDILGYPDLFYSLCVSMFILLWWWIVKEADLTRNWGLIIIAGLLAAVTTYARKNFPILLPMFLFFFFYPKHPWRWKAVGIFLLSYIVFCLPFYSYAARHHLTGSSSLFSWVMAEQTLQKELPLLQYRITDLSNLVDFKIFIRFFYKWFNYFNNFLVNLSNGGMWSIALPFGVGGMLLTTGIAAQFSIWFVFLLCWQVLILSFVRIEVIPILGLRYYLWAWPYFLLFSFAIFERAKKWKAWKLSYAIFLVVLVQFWVNIYLRVPRSLEHPSGKDIGDWPEIVYIRENTPSDAFIVSNVPTQISWYAKRRTVSLTKWTQDFEEMNNDWKFDYVFLSFHRIGEAVNFPEWRDAFHNAQSSFLTQLGFRMEREFPAGILYSRVNR